MLLCCSDSRISPAPEALLFLLLAQMCRARFLAAAYIALKRCNALAVAALMVANMLRKVDWLCREACDACSSLPVAAPALAVGTEGGQGCSAGWPVFLEVIHRSLCIKVVSPDSCASNSFFSCFKTLTFSPASLVRDTMPSQGQASSGA